MPQGVIVAVKPPGAKSSQKQQITGDAVPYNHSMGGGGGEEKTIFFIKVKQKKGKKEIKEKIVWFTGNAGDFSEKQPVEFKISGSKTMPIKAAKNVKKIKAIRPKLLAKSAPLQWFAAAALFLFAVTSLSKR